MSIVTLLVPAAVGVGVWFAWPKLPVDVTDDNGRGVLSAIVGMDATMLGFLVSAGALVYAIAQTTLVQNLFRTGHLQKLLLALFLDAGLFLVALCGALVGLLIKPELVFLRLLVALNAAALAGLIPLGYTMWHLLISAGPSSQPLDFE